MPLITALDPAPGRLGGFHIEVDDSLRFRVAEDLCRRMDLRTGARLTSREIESLEREAGEHEATERAVHFLSYRPRTCREVRRYLGRHGLAPHADAAIARCMEIGYLDDAGYAHSFVRERIRLKPRGRPRLVSELLTRGVDRDVAEQAVDAALAEEGVSEDALLRTVATRRARSLDRLDPVVARRRLVAYLGRRGFRGEAIRAVVQELLPDQSDARRS